MRKSTSTLPMSRTPKSTLPTTSIANEVRYCAWLRTCATTMWRYAAKPRLSTLHHELALALPLHEATQREDDRDPARLNRQERELPGRRSAFDQHVERELDDRGKRSPDDQRGRHRVGKEPHREEEAAQESRR